MAYTIH